MFLQLDGTFFVQLINFVVFFVALNWLFLRPVGRAIRKRREYIDGVRNDYDRYRREVAELEAQADAKRTAARREAESIVIKARSDANAEAQGIAAEFSDQAAALIAQAHKTIEGEVAGARSREPELAVELGQSLYTRAVAELSA